MTRKCLIALAILSMFAGSVAQADPAWGVTTAMVYEWAKKTTCPIIVYMKVVRWADIYGCRPILLIQQDKEAECWDVGDFVGCTWLKVCNNFANLRIDAVLEDMKEITIRKWYVSLFHDPAWETTTRKGKNYPQEPFLCPWNQTRQGMWGELGGGRDGKGSRGAKTTVLIPGVHLSDSLAWLRLCVKAKCNDPQSAMFDPDNPMNNVKQVAVVKLTFYPNDPPGAADQAQGAVTGDGAFPTDDLNDPDVEWDSMTGGGGGIPGSYHGI